MEKVIEENQASFELNNRGAAAKRNAVECKQTLKFPQEILYLFSDADGMPAKIDRVTSLHMFESCPQRKIAISYSLSKANG
jgi:hypothetical protein